MHLGTCRYMRQRVIHHASVPFVFVNYAGNAAGPYTDSLKITRRAIHIREVMFGFDLEATYDLGADYYYHHVWRFHDDGQFGSAMVIHGPGEEIHGRHTYHLPFRFDLDVSGSGNDSFQTLSSGNWTDVAKEGRHKSVSAPDYEWRVIDKSSRKNVQVRGRAGDDGDLWALQYKTSESWASWGMTRNTPPGSPNSVPAIYANNQSLQDTNVVLWYIAHIPAVDRVSVCGPWFRLEGYPKPPKQKSKPHGHM